MEGDLILGGSQPMAAAEPETEVVTGLSCGYDGGTPCNGTCAGEPYEAPEEEIDGSNEEELVVDGGAESIDCGCAGLAIDRSRVGDEDCCAQKLAACGSECKESDKNTFIDFVEFTNIDSLPYAAKRAFKAAKCAVKQMVAKKDFKVNYRQNTSASDSIVIKAGTLGGFVGENACIEDSWLDERSFVIKGEVRSSYVEDSFLRGDVSVISSYLNDVNVTETNECYIRKSTVKATRIEGVSYIMDSYVDGSDVKNALSIENCSLWGGDIDSSSVKNVNARHLVTQFADIKKSTDLFMCTPIGDSERTVCAYKTKMEGVRVSIGCFRGTLEELAIANAKTHLGYQFDSDGYLVPGTKSKRERKPKDYWTYTEYDMLIKFIKHHFKLDLNSSSFDAYGF